MLPDSGNTILLEAVTNKRSGENLMLRLYTNNVSPAKMDSAARYVEVSGGGYAAVELRGSAWGEVADGAIKHQPVKFEFNSPVGRVFGYYLTQAQSGKLLASERFTDGPYDVAHVGDQIKVTPVITGRIGAP